MVEASEIKEKIGDMLQGDPLFGVIRDTPLEATLYRDYYLTDLIEKKFYSTPEVAGWFEITDAQLRYYIKPFESYLFDDVAMNPTTATVIRLNLPVILKLRMILLLKDEYRVKGLKRLLGIDNNGHLIKKQLETTAVVATEELVTKVEVLSNILQQIMHTGLFHMEQDDETGAIEIEINQHYFAQTDPFISAESTKQISDIQHQTEQLIEENKSLQKQITEMNETSEKDLAVKIRERQLEKEVISTLHAEALEQFSSQKKGGVFAKLFRSSQIELEKEHFINAYLAEHLASRLEKIFAAYHEVP